MPWYTRGRSPSDQHSAAPQSKVVFVPGASAGVGKLVVRAIADAGHVVYAGVDSTGDTGTRLMNELDEYGRKNSVRLRVVKLLPQDRHSVDAAVHTVTVESGRIDTVVHTVGPATLGPIESFTPYQLSQLYDFNVVFPQRVNRAVLPQMRQRRSGMMIWLGRSLSAVAAPYLAPFSATCAAQELMAKSYAMELTGFGIDSHLLVPASSVPDEGSPEDPGWPDDIAAAADYCGASSQLLHQARRALRRSRATDEKLVQKIIELVGRPSDRPLLEPGRLDRLPPSSN
ncbi:SDR family NAD(P)-dependent oxidoreductase [Amycolatopsis sp. FDAARGOS 1241]|uniref:SDR family NAD(P)-dependent oxidoreductase n=1 Tax=Amycolatopsis sp. FDAARGOS 1241 TaxID=2778070 RepID=UPI00194FEBFB|nr:SDR family NAD(P)-dependent oxidoreductase [Amycolatopsis sp. FDAARGOS 1241]QRP42738.1 SDR family NAD(P)-dependent oxidoreductase [Amycolatopsis sp. FDAARGOS 1241]